STTSLRSRSRLTLCTRVGSVSMPPRPMSRRGDALRTRRERNPTRPEECPRRRRIPSSQRLPRHRPLISKATMVTTRTSPTGRNFSTTIMARVRVTSSGAC
ncbi:hypothetical protein BGZ52_011498, partial [Haplosporangium bisporale]